MFARFGSVEDFNQGPVLICVTAEAEARSAPDGLSKADAMSVHRARQTSHRKAATSDFDTKATSARRTIRPLKGVLI